MPSSVTYIQCDARFLHPFPPHSHPPNTTQQQIQPIPNELTNPTPPPNPPHFTLQHQKTQQLVRARSGGSGFSSGNESDDGNASGGSLGGDGSGGLGGYKIPAGVWRVGVFARFLKFENVRQHFPGAFFGGCLFFLVGGGGGGGLGAAARTHIHAHVHVQVYARRRSFLFGVSPLLSILTHTFPFPSTISSALLDRFPKSSGLVPKASLGGPVNALHVLVLR